MTTININTTNNNNTNNNNDNDNDNDSNNTNDNANDAANANANANDNTNYNDNKTTDWIIYLIFRKIYYPSKKTQQCNHTSIMTISGGILSTILQMRKLPD